MTHYVDMTNLNECMAILPNPGDTIVLTGVSINSMPMSVKRREGELYADFARKYGIHFIFDDEKPDIDFYSVPRLDIAATDGNGGFIASLEEPFDLRHPVPLVYISPERKGYLITGDSSEFLSIADSWRSHLTPCDSFRLFATKEMAKAEYNIVDFEKTDLYQRHMASFPAKPTVE